MSTDPLEHRRRAAGPPVPPQDRLWRHPSELGLQGDAGPRVVLHRRPSRARVLVAAAVGLVGGSVLGIGALAASGNLGEGSPTTVIEQVAAPVPRTVPAGELTVAETALPAVATVTVSGPGGSSSATGVVVRDDGLVLTTSDVLDAASEITVSLEDGSAYPAAVIGRDRSTDLGILDIDASGLPVAALPEVRLADAVSFGDRVVVVGTPSAPDAGPPDAGSTSGPTAGPVGGPVLASGYVTAPSTEVELGGESAMYGMVGVHLAPGTARPGGGALLLDGNGSLVGIVTARSGPNADDQSVSVYATPFDHARRVYQQVVETGQFTPPELPVEVEDPDAESGAESDDGGLADVTSGGGVVVAAEPTNPLAASADLRAGDVIVAINGVPVDDVNDKRTEIRRYVPGDEVDVTIIRDGEASSRQVTLSDDPRLR